MSLALGCFFFPSGSDVIAARETAMSRTRLLYELQKVDLELESVSRRFKEIDAMLGESVELERARKMAAEAEANLAKCRSEMQNLDLEVDGLSQKIRTNEERLYSGRVANPKELASLEEELASLKRWREKKEEDLLEAMVSCEESDATLADAQAILAQVNETWRAEQGKLAEEQTNLQLRLEELGDQRESLVAAVGPEDVTTYERLRPRKGGRAVAAVKEGLCEGCRMNPPSSQVQRARSGSDLEFCNNCGRILHVL
jgi:predicted  nucleic acid-binding Zn-ribbon protein